MKKLKPTQIIALIFVLIILIGAILLSLPIASRSGVATPFLDALFTATSATCLAGLSLFDTYTQWSIFGQVVILILIQIGGLGFMTIATLFVLLLKRKIGLMHRNLITLSTSSMHIGGVIRLTKHILIGTLIFEGIGALLLAFRFCPKMGFFEGIYYAIFHSVASFCSAGMDIMGKYQTHTSLATFSDDVLVNIVILALILIGGAGFIVWEDIYHNRWHWHKYSLHTKIVLSMMAFLTVVPTVFIFFTEQTGMLAGMNTLDALLASLFQTISGRTAGYSTLDAASFSPSLVILIMILMMIGGAPGSTAGGLKITTVFIIFRAAIATIKNNADISAFGRRFEQGALKTANAIFIIYITVAALAILLLSSLYDFPLDKLVFEVISAIGTVGLSLGITDSLGTAGKLIVILLMFFGRIGVLSIALVFAKRHTQVQLRYPEEKFMIG